MPESGCILSLGAGRIQTWPRARNRVDHTRVVAVLLEEEGVGERCTDVVAPRRCWSRSGTRRTNGLLASVRDT
jgi:hypothetical protein